jgi:sodium-dependent phosphate cotransporter
MTTTLWVTAESTRNGADGHSKCKVELEEVATEVLVSGQDGDGSPLPGALRNDASIFRVIRKNVPIFWVILKCILLVICLYFFVCMLSLLASAFRLLGGKTAGQVFAHSRILQNPIVGLTIGVLATVLLQSSSTTTSILVSMVAAELLSVKVGIPIVMGANIGTSMTNTLVSVAHSGDRAEFRRAFAGATVHDMFNCLSVAILLPIEVVSGYLFRLTSAIVNSMHLEGKIGSKPPKLLKAITGPFTKLIVQLDKNVIKDIAKGEVVSNETFSLIKRCCKSPATRVMLENNATAACATPDEDICRHIFAATTLPDDAIGIILLVVALGGLCFTLFSIVRLLHSMLSGTVAAVLKKTINKDFPYCSYLTGYLFLLLGTLLTILLQSSSIFTSALTPLVGIGVLSLERMYPLTLGANIGTTFTAVLAALATSGKAFGSTLQIALCHLFFNISGILMFYPVPVTRRAPIGLAERLGDTTAEYRWFVILYLLVMFFLVPAFIFLLSLGGTGVMLGVLVPIGVLILMVMLINVLQSKRPQLLPPFLRTWLWLPTWLRSLAPLDKLICKLRGIIRERIRVVCRRSEPEAKPETVVPVVTAATARAEITENGGSMNIKL